MRTVAVASAILFVVLMPAAGALPLGLSAPEATVAPATVPAAGETGRAPFDPSAMLTSSPYGDPLLRANPTAWVPVHASTGSLSEAAAAAAADLRIRTTLLPLGDVDGDGLADVLSETREEEEAGDVSVSRSDGDGNVEEYDAVTFETTGITLSALSGATHQPLWTASIDPDAWWYLLGDVDGDGIDEFVVETASGSSDGLGEGVLVAGAYVIDGSEQVHFDVRGGATGATLFGLDREFTFKYTTVYASALLGFADVTRYEYGYAGLVDLADGTSGVDVYELHVTSHDALALAFPLVGYALLWGQAETSTAAAERLGPDGKSKWTATIDLGGAAPYPVSNADYTGDGVPDLLFATYGNQFWLYACAVALVAGDCVSPESGLSQIRAALVDGADGDVAWELSSEWYQGYGGVLPGEAAKDGGRDVLMHQFGTFAGDPLAFATRITRLDGATGDASSMRAWPETFVLATGFADVDADGGEELLMLELPAAAEDGDEADFLDYLKTHVAGPDFAPLWTATGAEAGYPLYAEGFEEGGLELADLDGDGAADVIFARIGEDGYDFVGLHFRSGATGAVLWDLPIDEHGLAGLGLLGDINLDGGDDVGLMTFDVPAEPEEDLDYADHAAHVELLSGRDGQRIWKRAVYVPGLAPNATASYPWAGLFGADDTNGNGVPDVIVDFDGSDYFQEEGTEGLWFTLLIDGATGATLLGYPDAFAAAAGGGVTGVEAAPSDVELGPAAARAEAAETEERGQRGLLPGFEATLLVLASMGLALVGRRRRA